MGGSYFVAGEGGSNNGQNFDRAVEGFVINNDSPTALQYLTNPGCFEEVQTHELGHVLGLNHSHDSSALMYAYIDTGCMSGARGLRADDFAGVRFIYGGTTPTSITPPTVPPTDVHVVVQTSNVQVTWSDPPGDSTSAVTSYQVDFRAGHTDNGPVVASVRQSGSSIVVGVPSGVTGAFSVTVRGMNAAGLGPASPRQDFTLGGAPTTCTTAPAAPTGLSGAVSNGFARVQWSPSASATRYLIQAGSSTGGADLFAQTDLGAGTSAGASVPAGFRAWIRVFAANACGVSAPADFFLQ
jgi:hypothetical protein